MNTILLEIIYRDGRVFKTEHGDPESMGREVDKHDRFLVGEINWVDERVKPTCAACKGERYVHSHDDYYVRCGDCQC